MQMCGPSAEFDWIEEWPPDGTGYYRSDYVSSGPHAPLWTVLQRTRGVQKWAAIRQVLAGMYPDIAKDELAWLDRDGTLHAMTMPIHKDDRKPFVWSSGSEAKKAAEKKEKGVFTLAGWRQADFRRRKGSRSTRAGPPMAGSQGNPGLKLVWERGGGGFWYYSNPVTTSEGVVYWKVFRSRNGNWMVTRRWGHPGWAAWLDRDGTLVDEVKDVWKTSREAKEAAERKERGVLTLSGWREADFGTKGSRNKLADPGPSLLGQDMKAAFDWRAGPLLSVSEVDWGFYSDWRFQPRDRSSFEWHLWHRSDGGPYIALRIQMNEPGHGGRYFAWWLDREGQFRPVVLYGSQKRIKDAHPPDEAFVWKDQHEAMEAADLREGGRLTLAGWREAIFPLRRNMGSRTKRKVPLYHATSWDRVARIARTGLVPRVGDGVFKHGGYDSHSRGRLFVSEGLDAAREWLGKIGDMLEHDFSDDQKPDRLVPVLLRIDRPPRGLRVDPEGTRDVLGGRSFYLTQTIEPARLSFWDPREGAWRPIREWLASPPSAMLGIREVEHYDRAGDVVGEHDRWVARGFFPFGPYEPGGFKP
jgi:hypothetical protein